MKLRTEITIIINWKTLMFPMLKIWFLKHKYSSVNFITDSDPKKAPVSICGSETRSIPRQCNAYFYLLRFLKFAPNRKTVCLSVADSCIVNLFLFCPQRFRDIII